MRETGAVRIDLSGDRAEAAMYVNQARSLLGTLKGSMQYASLQQLSRIVTLAGGVTIACQSQHGQDTIRITVPPNNARAPDDEKNPADDKSVNAANAGVAMPNPFPYRGISFGAMRGGSIAVGLVSEEIEGTPTHYVKRTLARVYRPNGDAYQDTAGTCEGWFTAPNKWVIVYSNYFTPGMGVYVRNGTYTDPGDGTPAIDDTQLSHCPGYADQILAAIVQATDGGIQLPIITVVSSAETGNPRTGHSNIEQHYEMRDPKGNLLGSLIGHAVQTPRWDLIGGGYNSTYKFTNFWSLGLGTSLAGEVIPGLFQVVQMVINGTAPAYPGDNGDSVHGSGPFGSFNDADIDYGLLAKTISYAPFPGINEYIELQKSKVTAAGAGPVVVASNRQTIFEAALGTQEPNRSIVGDSGWGGAGNIWRTKGDGVEKYGNFTVPEDCVYPIYENPPPLVFAENYLSTDIHFEVFVGEDKQIQMRWRWAIYDAAAVVLANSQKSAAYVPAHPTELGIEYGLGIGAELDIEAIASERSPDGHAYIRAEDLRFTPYHTAAQDSGVLYFGLVDALAPQDRQIAEAKARINREMREAMYLQYRYGPSEALETRLRAHFEEWDAACGEGQARRIVWFKKNSDVTIDRLKRGFLPEQWEYPLRRAAPLSEHTKRKVPLSVEVKDDVTVGYGNYNGYVFTQKLTGAQLEEMPLADIMGLQAAGQGIVVGSFNAERVRVQRTAVFTYTPANGEEATETVVGELVLTRMISTQRGVVESSIYTGLGVLTQFRDFYLPEAWDGGISVGIPDAPSVPGLRIYDQRKILFSVAESKVPHQFLTDGSTGGIGLLWTGEEITPVAVSAFDPLQMDTYFNAPWYADSAYHLPAHDPDSVVSGTMQFFPPYFELSIDIRTDQRSGGDPNLQPVVILSPPQYRNTLRGYSPRIMQRYRKEYPPMYTDESGDRRFLDSSLVDRMTVNVIPVGVVRAGVSLGLFPHPDDMLGASGIEVYGSAEFKFNYEYSRFDFVKWKPLRDKDGKVVESRKVFAGLVPVGQANCLVQYSPLAWKDTVENERKARKNPARAYMQTVLGALRTP